MTMCPRSAVSDPPTAAADAAASSHPPGKTTGTRPWVMSLIVTALLAACGGGGDQAAADETVSSATASDMAADTAVVSSEAMAAADITVLTTETVAAAQASASAVASVPVSCPGGGSAVLSISGGSAASVLNGRFDAGETYAVVFSDCQAQTGGAAVTGAANLTVQSLSGTEARLALDLQALTVRLARGNVTLDGDLVWQGSHVTSGATTTLTTQLSIDRLSMTSAFGARTSSFELRNVDVSRQGTWVDGVPASSSMNGSYTIASSRPNGSFEATVTTRGSTQYGADSVPTGGVWDMAFTTWSMQMSLDGETVTLNIDQGKDGSIDKTYTTTRAGLSADAG